MDRMGLKHASYIHGWYLAWVFACGLCLPLSGQVVSNDLYSLQCINTCLYAICTLYVEVGVAWEQSVSHNHTTVCSEGKGVFMDQ